MQSRFNAAIALLVVALGAVALTSRAEAWNGAGHMAVAAIAYDNLTPKARKAVDALLRKHPDYAVWVQDVTAARDRGRVAFIQAATWPDDIKWDKRFYNDDMPRAKPKSALQGFPDMKRHKDWHYVDYPYTMDKTPMSAPPKVNALTAIGGLIATIGSSKGTAAMRSYALPWLIHLVGDLHQPLHCIDRFSKEHPKGDRGGNEFKVSGSARELHAFWDNLLGKRKDIPTVTAVEARLAGVYGPGKARALQPVMLKTLDPTRWARESRDTARKFVYSLKEGTPGHPVKITPAYQTRAAAIADERISLAGYRLARILNNALG